MIKVLYKEGRFIPVVVCDICGQQITEARNGAVANTWTEDIQEPGYVEILYAHKGACHDIAEARLSQKSQTIGWEELSHHLLYVVRNAGLTIENLEKLEHDYQEFLRWI